MIDSILDTIKRMLGIPSTDTAFDSEILVNINAAFMVLNQLGVGPAEVYHIEDNTATWSDFLSTDEVMYSAVKTFIFISVKLTFDPPSAGYVLDALSRQRDEITWRLNVQVPIPPTPPPPEPPEEP